VSVTGLQFGRVGKRILSAFNWLYGLLAIRAYSVIMFGALFCTLAVKFFHSWRTDLLNEYFEWVLADVSVLLGIEVILAIICFRWPRKWVIRTVTFAAALVCTWSVINAGWLIRTGSQILPPVLLPLGRSPLNNFRIVGSNLIEMPKAAFALLGPSAVALAFFFHVFAKPMLPNYNNRRFIKRIIISVIIVMSASVAHGAVARRGSPQIASAGLRFNSQLKAIASLILADYRRLPSSDRKIPFFDEIKIGLKSQERCHNNVVIVILEGVQYNYTSLADKQSDITPFLAALAEQGVEFTNARSTVTHTTKALFTLLTGRFPSASEDLAETVPAKKSYVSIATILEEQLNFRTAFFQSAKGNFESRPSLVHNLGFDKFWARDYLDDPNSFLGYLACDEISMLEPITEWIKADEKPFLLTIMCSVTHDPYEVPEWFAEPAEEPVGRYRQTISYTDKFLAALDEELGKLNLTDKTIFCVIGDHGEAFGEHGLLGHEQIAFDEVLRIPFCLRAPSLVKPKTKLTDAVSSVDLTPTLLALLNFDISLLGFDGINITDHIPVDRNVYFSGWMRLSPAGFIKASQKFIYNPADKTVTVYDLNIDPLELVRIELQERQSEQIADEIIAWRQSTIFHIDQQRTGKKMLFDHWLCRWTNRVCTAKYQKKVQ
jgi:arylsulfatase A-like enzyme